MPKTNQDKRKLDRDKCPKKLQEKLTKIKNEKAKILEDRPNYTVVAGDMKTVVAGDMK